MEKRQDSQHDLIRLETHLFLDLVGITEDIAMRQDDAFGIAGRARCEDDCGLGVEPIAAKSRYEGTQGLRGHQLGNRGSPELIRQSYLLGDIFQQDQRAFGHDLEPVEDLRGSQHVGDPALVDRGVDQTS